MGSDAWELGIRTIKKKEICSCSNHKEQNSLVCNSCHLWDMESDRIDLNRF